MDAKPTHYLPPAPAPVSWFRRLRLFARAVTTLLYYTTRIADT